MAQMHDSNIPSPNISSADRGSSDSNLSALWPEMKQHSKRHAHPPIPVLAAAQLEPLAPALLTRQTPNPVHNTSITRSLSRKHTLNDRVKTRCTVKRKIQSSAANRKRALELQSDSFRTSGNCRSKRKRWSSSISTTL